MRGAAAFDKADVVMCGAVAQKPGFHLRTPVGFFEPHDLHVEIHGSLNVGDNKVYVAQAARLEESWRGVVRRLRHAHDYGPCSRCDYK